MFSKKNYAFLVVNDLVDRTLQIINFVYYNIVHYIHTCTTLYIWGIPCQIEYAPTLTIADLRVILIRHYAQPK